MRRRRIIKEQKSFMAKTKSESNDCVLRNGITKRRRRRRRKYLYFYLEKDETLLNPSALHPHTNEEGRKKRVLKRSFR
jgi:hypothetical protein